MAKESMNISTTWKIVIGAATALVALQPVLSIYFFLRWFFMALRAGASAEPYLAFVSEFFIVFPVLMVIACLQMALTVFYLVHTIKTISHSDTTRLLLGIGTCFLPFIIMPAYFVVFIWMGVRPDWERREKVNKGA